MPNYDTVSKNWEYRGEGNLHIIVAHKFNRVVLRLPKRFVDKENTKVILDRKQCEEAEQEISFQKHVVFPVLHNCHACFNTEIVDVREDFLRKLNVQIHNKRPQSRLHKEVNTSCTKAVLLPDHSFVIPRPLTSNKFEKFPHLCFEIKPKKGFLSEGKCTFCKQQTLKLKRGDCSNISQYCPIDLFSGSKQRMYRALKGLIEYPQNNFKVFRNGEYIYGNGVNEKTQNPMESFATKVLSLISEKSNNLLEILLEVLCALLLEPLIKLASDSKLHEAEECPMSKLLLSKNGYRNGLIKKDPLVKGCILDLILTLQKLQTHSLKEYYDMYYAIEKDVIENINNSFHTEEWKDLVTEIKSNPKNAVPFDLLTVDNYAQCLQKFIISTSLKDCSILLTLQQSINSNHDTNSIMHDKSGNTPLLLTTHGVSFWCSIAVIDCDPKPLSRIPSYVVNENECDAL